MDQPLALVGSIRGIAMLGVFAMHATIFLTLSGHRVPGRDYLVEAGRVSVAVFFVLAGFLLYLPFAIARLSATPPPALKAYYIRRGARIIPAYWFVLLVSALLYGWTYVFTPEGFVTYFGFLQIYSDETLGRGLFPTWAIGVLVLFYVVLPAWAALMRRIPASGPASFGRTEAGMLLGLALVSVVWKIWAYGQEEPSVGGSRPGASLLVVLPAFLDHFAIGMALAVLFLLVSARGADRPRAARFVERYPTVPWAGAALLFVFIVAIDAWVEPGLMVDSEDPEIMAAHVLAGVVAVALLLPTLFGTARRGVVTRVLANPALVFFGTVSYGFFLWHGPILQELHGELATLGPKGYVAAALAASFVAATVSYYLVERPAARLGRRLPRRGTDRPPACSPALRRLPVVAPVVLAVTAAALVAWRVAYDERQSEVIELTSVEGQPAILSPEGETAVLPGAVAGAVHRLTTCGRAPVVRGWATNRRSGRPADRVLVFSGRRLLAQGAPDLRRGDVTGLTGRSLDRSGFVVGERVGAGSAAALPSVRVVAIAGDRASELPVPRPVPAAKTMRPTTLARDGRRLSVSTPSGTARVVPGAIRGFVDHLVAWGTSLASQGWAADTAHGRPPDCVLAFAGGRLIAGGPPTVRRPDIARAYGAAAEHAGFRFGVRVGERRARELARPGVVRVFAVAGRRASQLPMAAAP